MKAKKRQKLCHHCEGEVDLDVIVCPFCAADLREERPEQPRFIPTPTLSKSLPAHSLYPPLMSETKSEPSESQIKSANPQIQKNFFSIKSITYGMVLFALGSQLLFLTIALLLFSHHGTLLLQFNAKFWPLCLLLSIPLLVFGYRLTNLDD